MHPILQSESSECALASLAMVANAHGLQLDLFDLRRRFPVSSQCPTETGRHPQCGQPVADRDALDRGRAQSRQESLHSDGIPGASKRILLPFLTQQIELIQKGRYSR